MIREFTCEKCGHRVVVNPRLPPDYVPNICTPCAEKRDNEWLGKFIPKLAALLQAVKRL